MFGVDSVGHSGGLYLLWEGDFNVDIQNFSRRHINTVIGSCGTHPQWKFIGFYGHPNTTKRKELWDLLTHLNSFQPTLWLCVGDFDEIVSLLEKKWV
jgi:hypothetical protein